MLYVLRSVPGLSFLEMPVNLSQYRGSVGIFNNRNFFVIALNIKKSSSFGPYFPHLPYVTCFAGIISFW